jgi:GDP-4-dehydro-6-deoxy-D-mannose reductase
MRAFVTGARGFVGRFLCAHLGEAGDTVEVGPAGLDVTDGPATQAAIRAAQPDVVYHLAAFTHVGESWREPERTFRVNALGTLQVLLAAKACPTPPRVLLVSSAEVYGSPAQLPLREDAPLAPVSPYAASKVAAEYLGVQAHLGEGVPVIRVRPFNHVGPGQSPAFVVSALAKRIVEAERTGLRTVRVGALGAKRDFTDVRDVVRAYRMLMLDGRPGEVYNVCSGRAVSIEELARRLLGLAGADLVLEHDPALERPVEIPVLCGDPTRIEQATGWVPETDLDRTLRDVLDHWRSAAPTGP